MKKRSTASNKRISAAKKALSVLLAALMLTGVLGCGLAVTASAESERLSASELDLSFSAGYNGDTVFYDKSYPVSVTLDNKTSGDLEGYILIEFGLNNYTNFTPDSSFKLPFSVAAGTKKKTEITVSGVQNTDYRLSVRDKSGRLLRQITGRLDQLGDTLLIGWMSDNASTAKIFERTDGYVIGYRALQTQRLTPDAFPSSIDMIMQFAIIVVNNVDLSASSSFSAAQIKLLKKYIEAGGTVIIGTGTQGPDILKSFSEYFASPVSASVTVNKNVSFYQNYLNGDYSFFDICAFMQNGDLSGPAADSELDKSDPEGKYDEHEQDYTTGYYNRITFNGITACGVSDANFSNASGGDSGIVLYKHASKDLYIANIDLVCREMTNSSDSGMIILCAIAGAGAYSRLNIDTSTNYSSYGSSFLKIMQNRSPKLWLMILLIIVYLCAGITLPFLLARSKKKYMTAWIGIPVAAVLCTVVIFLYGFIVKGGGSVSNTLVIAEIYPTGDVTARAASQVKSPSSGKRRLSYTAENVTYGREIFSHNSSDLENSVISYLTADSGINYSGINAWDYTAAEGCWDATGQYSAFDISWRVLDDGSTVRITVKNTTGKDLSDATVYALGNTLVIGDFPAGKTFETDVEQKFVFYNCQDALYGLYYKPLGIPSSLADDDFPMQVSYGGFYSGYYMNRSEDDMFSLLEDRSDRNRAFVLYHFANDQLSQSSGSFSSITVTGFDDSAEDPLRINGKKAHKSNSETLVTQTVKVTEVPGSSLSLSGTALLKADESLGVARKENDQNSCTALQGCDVVAVYAIPVPYPVSSSVECSFTVRSSASGSSSLVYLIYPDENTKYAAKTYELKTDVDGKCGYRGNLSPLLSANPNKVSSGSYYDKYIEYSLNIGGCSLWVSPQTDGKEGSDSSYYLLIAVYYDAYATKTAPIDIYSVEYSIEEVK